jgi:hypothetical protein
MPGIVRSHESIPVKHEVSLFGLDNLFSDHSFISLVIENESLGHGRLGFKVWLASLDIDIWAWADKLGERISASKSLCLMLDSTELFK